MTMQTYQGLGGLQSEAPTLSSSALSECIQGLESLCDSFGSSLGRLDEVAFRAFGGNSAEQKADLKSTPNGAIGKLREQLARLNDLSEAIQSAIAKVESIV